MLVVTSEDTVTTLRRCVPNSSSWTEFREYKRVLSTVAKLTWVVPARNERMRRLNFAATTYVQTGQMERAIRRTPLDTMFTELIRHKMP